MLVERLRTNDHWTLAHRLSEKLNGGGELVLSKEEKEGLLRILEGMRNADDPKLSQRLNLLANDLDDDLYSYDSSG